MTDAMTDEARKGLEGRIALHRLGKPDDVAYAAVFLASETGGHITGTVMNVSGGLYTLGSKAESRDQRYQRSESGNQKPETRNQKPETRNQKPRLPLSGFWFLVSDFWFLVSVPPRSRTAAAADDRSGCMSQRTTPLAHSRVKANNVVLSAVELFDRSCVRQKSPAAEYELRLVAFDRRLLARHFLGCELEANGTRSCGGDRARCR